MVELEKRKPDENEINSLGVRNWSIWTKEVSEFPWEYDEKETFYVLEGEAEIVTPTEKLKFGAGDLVTCHSGVTCTWKITKPIKKHYHFGSL
ncbi:MAG: cupin domain-containing protein [Promethearchaeota archaeon]